MGWESGGSARSQQNQANSIDGGGASPISQGTGNFVSLGVGQLILDTLPKLAEPALQKANPSGTTIYEAINYVTSMIARRLLNRRSDLLKTSEMTITVTSESQAYDLSPDFLALAESPWPTGRPPMEPITGHRQKWDGRSNLYPVEYEVLGSQIFFYPALTADSEATVKARYYPLPAWVSSYDDVIPFLGMFDGIYRKAVPRCVIIGLKIIQADADFETFMNQELEPILNARVQPLPSVRTSRRNFI